MIMNKALFDDMSEEDQQIVQDALAAISEYATLKRAGEEEEFKEILTDRGMELYDMDTSLFDEYTAEFNKNIRRWIH